MRNFLIAISLVLLLGGISVSNVTLAQTPTPLPPCISPFVSLEQFNNSHYLTPPTGMYSGRYEYSIPVGGHVDVEIDLGSWRYIDRFDFDVYVAALVAANTRISVFAENDTDPIYPPTLMGGSSGFQWRMSPVFAPRFIRYVRLHIENASGSPASVFRSGQVRVRYCNTPPPVFASFTTTTLSPSEYAPKEVQFNNTSTGEVLGYAWSFTHGDMGCISGTIQSTLRDPVFIYEEPGTYTVCLKVTGVSSTDIAYTTITVLDSSPSAAALVAPLSPEERNQELHHLYKGMYSLTSVQLAEPEWANDPCCMGYGGSYSHDEDIVFALSNNDNSDVMAAAAGEVIEISPITREICDNWFGTPYGANNPDSYVGWECIYSIPQPIHGTAISPLAFRVALNYAFVVKVRFSTGYWISYFVSNPSVKVGDTIDAGCILGKTMRLFPWLGVDVNAVFNLLGGKLGLSGSNATATGFSLTVLASLDIRQIDPDPIDALLPALQIDALPSTRCDQTPAYSSCIGDAEMRNQHEWESNGSVVWDATGVTLYYGGSIRDQVPLSETEYGLDVNIERLTDVNASVAIALGNTRLNLQIPERSAVYSIPSGEHPPDAGLFHSIYIENTGQAPIRITRACVSEGGGAGEGIPVSGTCQLRNFTFVQGIDGWTTSGITVQPGVYRNVITATGGATLQQTVALATGNNRVDVNYRVNGLNTPTFDYTLDGGATWTAMSSDYASNPLNRTASASFNMAISTPSAFGIRVNLASGTTTIEQVCITPEVLPGGGGTIGHLPHFDMKCKSQNEPPAPEIINPGPWLFWHYSKLEQFFNCDLMILLNKMHMTMNETLSFIKWQALYWQSYVLMYGRWIKSAVLWAEGYLANLTAGQTTTIIDGMNQCSDIGCILSQLIQLLSLVVEQVISPILNMLQQILDMLLPLIGQAISLLISVVRTIISLVVGLLIQIFVLWQMLIDFLTTIFTAWNTATPQHFSFMPRCDVNPRGNALCIILWTAENTVFSRAGSLVIPIIIGAGSILMLIDSVARIRNAIMEMNG